MTGRHGSWWEILRPPSIETRRRSERLTHRKKPKLPRRVSMCRTSGPGGTPLNVTRPSFQHRPSLRLICRADGPVKQKAILYEGGEWHTLTQTRVYLQSVLTRRADMRANQKSASVFGTRNLDEWFCNVVDALRIHKDFFFLHRSLALTAGQPILRVETSPHAKIRKQGEAGGLQLEHIMSTSHPRLEKKKVDKKKKSHEK